jgi:hypothetical protein
VAWLNDTFTGTNGTNLQAHTGETGATWTVHPSYTGPSKIQTNRVQGNGLVTAYYASGSPAGADYDVTAIVRQVTSFATAGPCGRMDTTADTHYGVRLTVVGGVPVAQLYKMVAGVITGLGSTFAVTNTNGTDTTLMLRMRGSTISMFVNGTQRESVTDTDISAAGKAGVRLGASTTTTGFHIDSISAVNLFSGVADIPGAGSISGTATRKAMAAAAVAGAGSVAASATRKALAAASVAGTGAISGSAVRSAVAVAGISGTGSIAASGVRSALGSVSLAGTGAISAAAVRSAIARAEISGTGGVNATGGVTHYGAASLSGTGSLVGAAVRIVSGAVAVNGAGSLAGAAHLARSGQAAITGTGLIAASGGLLHSGVALVSGTGAIQATGVRRLVTIDGGRIAGADEGVLVDPFHRGSVELATAGRVSHPQTGKAG